MAGSILQTPPQYTSGMAYIDKYPSSHFLGIPLETRLQIFHHVLDGIHIQPRLWDGPPGSPYDGLQRVCKQLFLETASNVFLHRVTCYTLPRLIGIIPTRTNVLQLRLLYLKLPFDIHPGRNSCVATILDKFQLSIQELHLSFHGCDRSGAVVKVNGCGKQVEDLDEQAELRVSYYDMESRLTLLRQIANLRQLRILRMENLNFPVPQAVLDDKPYLTAVSITTDRRTKIPNFEYLLRRDPGLLKGVGGRLRTKPPVKVIELDANSALAAEGTVNSLISELEHFSWRAPDYNHQNRAETYDNSFSRITARLLQTLSVYAPNLKTLRLCISASKLVPGNEDDENQICGIVMAMSSYLPRYQALEILEIHHIDNYWYYKNHLVASLPDSLRRLHISDHMILVKDLVEQVRSRYILEEDSIVASHIDPVNFSSLTVEISTTKPREYMFGCLRDDAASIELQIDGEGVRFRDLSDRASHHGSYARDDQSALHIPRSLHQVGDYMVNMGFVGESSLRKDHISLSGGSLGFIDFEYGPEDQSTRADLFRLNGLLLDREHNMHLANTQGTRSAYGIPPKQNESLLNTVKRDPFDDSEMWAELHQKVCFPVCKTVDRCNYVTRERTLCEESPVDRKDFGNCFDASMDWYFGEEVAARKVFDMEPVAPVQGQKQKPMLEEVRTQKSERCQWSAPGYEVESVGSFPNPVVPRDWKNDVK